MFCPSGFCICRTVQLESIRIWNDLQDAETFNSPLHEDSITQTLALSLNRQHGGQNRVHLFNRAEESKNGSDFLWIFFSSDLARLFRVAVQGQTSIPEWQVRGFQERAGAKFGYLREVDFGCVGVRVLQLLSIPSRLLRFQWPETLCVSRYIGL